MNSIKSAVKKIFQTLFSIVFLVSVGCQTPPALVSPVSDENHSPDQSVVLREGDTLKITFPSNPRLDTDQAVRRDAIPLITQIVRHDPNRFGAAMLNDLFTRLQNAWPGAKLDALALALSPFLTLSIQSTERPMIRLSQKFEFAASHRLHNPALSEEKNRQTFGKCNNPHGHGHNYELQVTLTGTPGENGLLIDIPAFEETVARTVIDKFDHKNLNIEVSEFAAVIPSVENIAKVIYSLLKPRLQSERTKLASVTVWETGKTSCEYSE